MRSGSQSSVLGLLLFSMYLNNFFSVIEAGVWSVYALVDDIELVFHGTQPRDALQIIIHETLDHFELWMKPKSMSLNSSK